MGRRRNAVELKYNLTKSVKCNESNFPSKKKSMSMVRGTPLSPGLTDSKNGVKRANEIYGSANFSLRKFPQPFNFSRQFL